MRDAARSDSSARQNNEEPKRNMLPEDQRLLNGTRRALLGLAANASPGDKATFDAVDAVLSELLLRTERGFYVEHHAQGLHLAKAGIALADGIGTRTGFAARLATLTPVLDPLQATDILWPHIDALRKLLEEVVRAVSQQPEAQDWLTQIVDWENRFHGRHAALPPLQTAAIENRYTPEKLRAYLQQKFPAWQNVVVHDARVLPGGFSKKTVLLDISDDVNGARSLVLRVEQPPRYGFGDGDQVENEFVVLQLIFEAGLAVAEPLWLETDKRHVGQKFIVSKKAAGQNVGSAIGASSKADPALVRDVVRHLVAIHNTRLDANDERIRNSHLKSWAGYKTLTESTTAWVEHWLTCIRDMQVRASPLTVRLMEWLRHNVPVTDEPPSLLHGDFGLHNVLFEGDKVSCILDWEYMTFGDPAEDIALLVISLGGQMSAQEILAMYRECGGRPISEFRQRYFDLIYAMKFIVPCENAFKLYQDHEEASIGLCKWGFHYTIAGVGNLNEKIALAEAARGK
jgi:aminoglycoside phosphotransferase (APT) family kinase protein